MSKNVLTDSCYWIALYTDDDYYHEYAILFDEFLEVHRLIIPWPSLYEFLNTKFTGKPYRMTLFQKKMLQPNIMKIPDYPYRDNALSKFFGHINIGRRLSLVDLVIREILSDETVRIDSLVTFDEQAFADLCAFRRIELFNG